MDDLFKAIERVAAHKRQAAESRARGVDPTLEKAQDVVTAAARQIAARFAPAAATAATAASAHPAATADTAHPAATADPADAFKFAASARKLTRKVGDWSQEIHFDGGGANSPGRTIHFAVFAFVRNAALKRWQQNKPSAFFRPGHLPPDVAVVSERVMPGWRRAEWQLTEARNRPTVIDAAEQHIRTRILPVLKRFTDRDALRDALTTDTRTDSLNRLVNLDTTIDLLMCYFDAETAARAVDHFVAANESDEFATHLAHAFAKARAGHRPENRSSPEIIAVAVERYDLPVAHPLLTRIRTAKLPPYDPLAEWERSRATRGDLVSLLQAAGYRVDPR